MQKKFWPYSISALVGILCGLISTHWFLAGTWWNLIFWGVIGLGIGYNVAKEAVVWSGILFGGCTVFAFLVSDYGGTTAQLRGFLVLLAIGVVIGMVCGLACVWVGNWIRRQIRRGA